MTVHPFIEAEKAAGHNVKRACGLLTVSRTAFYARRTGKPGPRAVRDAVLTQKITEVHEKSRGTYGSPRVHAVLKREGAGCGRRRVARLMRAAGLQGRHRRRRHLTTIPDPRAAMRPGLVVRDFHPDAAGLDTRWCGDITYIPTEEGRLYLATVIDIASRRVVGWATADHLRTELVADALTAACRQRRPKRPVTFHSDRGCQYSSQQFALLAGEFSVRLSVGRTGQCWDNAVAEWFFATIKRELLGTTAWPSRAAARTAIFDFIESWYNLHRLHSSLGYRSSAAYETGVCQSSGVSGVVGVTDGRADTAPSCENTSRATTTGPKSQSSPVRRGGHRRRAGRRSDARGCPAPEWVCKQGPSPRDGGTQ
ncbi:IS3 family transposase [Streptomyces atratus]|uniref:IS3 family transposase n=1 Tax=Streptomyces atratus TaxID=1893 RepID=UPI0021A81495|nr:IS3 family transposase [Streptomyces atratus]MCT2544097.1 IS3 family transposase [Streptomyces atratus]